MGWGGHSMERHVVFLIVRNFRRDALTLFRLGGGGESFDARAKFD